MGIGHRVYKVKDPRATVLQELAEHVFAETSRPKNYETALELERDLRRHLRPEGHLPERRFLLRHRLPGARHPDGPVHADLRHRPRRRLAGPLAGATVGNRIFRPEQIYVGKTDVKYVPLERDGREPMSRLQEALEQIDFARALHRWSGIDDRAARRVVHDPAERRVARRLAGRAPRVRRVPALPRAAPRRARPDDETLISDDVPEGVRPRLAAGRRSPGIHAEEIRDVFDRVHA